MRRKLTTLSFTKRYPLDKPAVQPLYVKIQMLNAYLMNAHVKPVTTTKLERVQFVSIIQ